MDDLEIIRLLNKINNQIENIQKQNTNIAVITCSFLAAIAVSVILIGRYFYLN